MEYLGSWKTLKQSERLHNHHAQRRIQERVPTMPKKGWRNGKLCYK